MAIGVSLVPLTSTFEKDAAGVMFHLKRLRYLEQVA